MSSNKPNVFEFVTPVGRLVAGDAFEPQTTDQQGNPLLDRKTGQPTQRWFMGVAFDKRNPEFNTWYAGLQAQAMRDWPHLFDAATGQCRLPTFSMKIIDGDGYDQSGRPWNEREGYAGHWVARFNSGFAPSVFHKDKYDPLMRVMDPQALKRGYYVRIMGNARGNGNTDKPGMYLNLSLVEIYGIGQVISGGPDASVFGSAATPTFIPQGMTEPGMVITGTVPGLVSQQSPGIAQQQAGIVLAPGIAQQQAGVLPGMIQAVDAGGMIQQAGVIQQQPIVGGGHVVVGSEGANGSLLQAPVGHLAASTGGSQLPGNQHTPHGGATPDVLVQGMQTGLNTGIPGVAAQNVPQVANTVPAQDPMFVASLTGEQMTGVVMGPNAQGIPYETWRQQGHSDDVLRQAGIIL